MAKQTFPFKEYIKNILKTENKDFEDIKNRLSFKSSIRLLHGSVGASTEAGELLDAIKKFIFYGKPIDRVNVKEEIGDIFYYTGLIMDELGFELEDILDTNIKKLEVRYGDKFNDKSALERDLEKERRSLEELGY